LISDVIASFATALQTQGVETVLEIQAGMAELEADPLRLHQVLGNLVSNAVHHLSQGGTLTVSARHEAGRVIIEVADTGPGIPADRLQQVFERFVKAGDSAGTGLGLSIARDLVEAHGGTISASNRPQGGALFTIDLPA
ncbi:MAG: sensor histidine kinase, partial [Acidimicrobiia bacterium]